MAIIENNEDTSKQKTIVFEGEFITDHEHNQHYYIFSGPEGAPYVEFEPGDEGATLDGWFSLENLEAVIAEIKKHLNVEEKP